MKQFQVYSTFCYHTKKITNNTDKPPIKVLFGDIRSFQDIVTELVKLLSEEETKRMNKLLVPEDQICYLVVHALLKKHLSDILNRQNQEIMIDFYNQKKPYISGIDLDFNISHSKHLFSYIIADNLKLHVGIDIEKISTKIERVVHKFLSKIEIDSIDSKNRLLHLYICWSAKEALYKIHINNGLSYTEDIILQPFNPLNDKTISAYIQSNEKKTEYILNFQIIDNHSLVWTLL